MSLTVVPPPPADSQPERGFWVTDTQLALIIKIHYKTWAEFHGVDLGEPARHLSAVKS